MAAGHPDNSSNLKQFQSSNRSLGIENGNWTNTSRDWRPTGPHFLASVQLVSSPNARPRRGTSMISCAEVRNSKEMCIRNEPSRSPLLQAGHRP